MELKLSVRARRLYSYLQPCLSCAPLPPSLLCLSIIKLARFSAAGAGRGLALFERRPFKSLQTNGTGPRSAVTKPTGLSLRPELPACLPASSPSSEFRRDQTQTQEQKKKKKKKKGGRESLRGVTHMGKSDIFFLRCTSQPWFVFEEQPRRWMRTQTSVSAGEKRREKRNAAREGSSPARP